MSHELFDKVLTGFVGTPAARLDVMETRGPDPGELPKLSDAELCRG